MSGHTAWNSPFDLRHLLDEHRPRARPDQCRLARRKPFGPSNQKAKLDTTRRGEPVSRPTARPGGLATDNTAGSRSTPMASGCGTMHVNARNVTPTNYKHNIQAQRVTSQRKPTTTTKVQARHKQHSQPTTSTSCQLSTCTTSWKEKFDTKPPRCAMLTGDKRHFKN